ncbi:type I phosphomannose isomerase catalytic subunit [Moorella naiadis]|uniref:type I phosphomannose isomerase catalytic subunit n=1 Tax=Moorella naiadis (nom. illeg.) TaxID=3093670 RepID=UPI003D9C85F5
MLYPLKFHPHLRFYPFGGYKIARMFPKEDIPADRPVAESWEISACPGAEAVIKNGPLAGLNLQEAVDKLQADLVGAGVWERYGNYFPLLIKFLDAAKDLPPQVHPDDEYAARANLPYRGKTEAWYIHQADPGAYVWCGSKPGLTREEFRNLIASGATFAPMKKLTTRPGETYFIPAGRLHAIGAGNFIVEVQQNSDAVFVWDWLDWEVDDEHRKSDIEHSLAAALIEDGEPENITPVTIQRGNNIQEYLCACHYFAMERLTIHEPWQQPGDPRRFEALVPVAGKGRLIYGPDDRAEAVQAGEALLLPAKLGPWLIEPEGKLQLIRAIVPVDLQKDLVEPLRAKGINRPAIIALGGYGKGNDLHALIG